MDLTLDSGTYKFISGKRKKVVDIEVKGETIYFEFDYDEFLKEEVKVMDGARWDPDTKRWRAKNSRHNRFQIAFLQGLNPYARYDEPLKEFKFRIPKFEAGVTEKNCLFPQQYQMACEGLTYRQMIWAAEMGLGKTLSAFMVIENSEFPDWWWVGPRSALASYEVELDKWGLLRHMPSETMTYEGLVKLLSNWPKDKKIPQGIILDESSRVKTPGSKRSQACWAIAEKMRDTYGDDVPYVIEMTGTPAPKDPSDWFHQCEIACPGFIREGNIHKFKERLAYIKKEQNAMTGGFYPKLLGWKDSKDRCSDCGCMKDVHDFQSPDHPFRPGSDEVSKLYRRMKGLVSVYYKKDWMTFLPEKQYRILRCKPTRAMTNAAKIVKDSSRTAIEALVRLRELSDGFQYRDKPSGRYETCSLCNGSKRVSIPDYEQEEMTDDFFDVKMIEIDCTNCNGSGQVEIIERSIEAAGSPKDDLLDEIIDDHDDDGRLVVYAGFTGSIDRIQEMFVRKGWNYIRVDGRGWSNSFGAKTPKQMLLAFQGNEQQKVVYIAHPMSGGMGVTLTKSHETVFYSNDFSAESRLQAEDRIHRPGMDVNRGAMITDLFNLPSDELVYQNLMAKKRLQDLTMGAFKEALKLDLER